MCDFVCFPAEKFRSISAQIEIWEIFLFSFLTNMFLSIFLEKCYRFLYSVANIFSLRIGIRNHIIGIVVSFVIIPIIIGVSLAKLLFLLSTKITQNNESIILQNVYTGAWKVLVQFQLCSILKNYIPAKAKHSNIYEWINVNIQSLSLKVDQ